MISSTIEVQGSDVSVGLYPLRNRTRVIVQKGDTAVVLEPSHVFAMARVLAEVGISDTATPSPASFATSA